MKRHFLDPTQPLLPQAADFIWQLGDSSSTPDFDSKSDLKSKDLSSWIVVVPTARAANRLLEQLVELAEPQNQNWIPPQITTIGALPELLYEAKYSFASHAVQKFAWLRALFQLNKRDLGRLIHDAPTKDLIAYWLEISDLLARLHRELASESLVFADVPRLVRERSKGEFPDQDRWDVLIKLQAHYRTQLDRIEIWDRQLARLVAIQKAQAQAQNPELNNQSEFTNDRKVLLVATADLSKSIREILSLIEADVVSLVYSNASEPELFDEQGCLNPQAWSAVDQSIPSQDLIVADKPADQAAALVDQLVRQQARYSRDEVAIALTDASLAPVIQRRLLEAGQNSRWLGGLPISRSKPVRLLTAIANFLDSETYADFAALIRHPDVHRWLEEENLKRRQPGEPDSEAFTNASTGIETNSNQLLQRWDRFQNAFLPHRLQQTGLSGRRENDACRRDFIELQKWLAPLTEAKKKWSTNWFAIRELLLSIYGDKELNQDETRDKETWDSLEMIAIALDELESIPKELQVSMAPADAIRVVLREIQAKTLGLPRSPEDLDLLGWLDVPWEDAQFTVVVGFNEGCVPEGEASDLFLPDQVRGKLGINDNARRYARDAYSLSLLRAPHRELRLIMGRHDVEGNPLSPSRLLFAIPDEKLGPLALHLFRDPQEADLPQASPKLPAPTSNDPTSNDPTSNDSASNDSANAKPNSSDKPPAIPQDTQQLVLPRPDPECEILTALSVTRFSSYLYCPYRFYLEQILRLETIDDSQDELDAGEFGTLLHTVLERFAESDLKDSTDPRKIAKTLREWTDRLAKQTYGQSAQPSVAVQLEQMKHRFDDFSGHQARRASEGWEIWKAEGGTLKASFPVDGEDFTIRGRIDRIDRHRKTGEFAVLDYKTSDSRGTPEKSHRPKGIWVNLQLPLYRHLVRSLPEIQSAPVLGFVSLPKEGGVGGFHIAPWSETEMQVADEVARDVIRCIRQRLYWPPSEMQRFDDWEVICQTQTNDRHPDDVLLDRTLTQQPQLPSSS